jgi:hypothetical protein
MGYDSLVDSHPLPMSGVGYQASSGQLGLWTPGHGFLIIRIVRHGAAEFADPILSSFDEVLSTDHVARLYFDVEQLHGYNAELRTVLTEHFRRERASIRCLRVLLRSRVVGMGVSVANLALGGLAAVYSERREFLGDLDSALAAAGVVGFSTSVLGAPALGDVFGNAGGGRQH